MAVEMNARTTWAGIGTNYLWQSMDAAKGESKPMVTGFDLPFGSHGIEISLNYTVGKFSILPTA